MDVFLQTLNCVQISTVHGGSTYVRAALHKETLIEVHDWATNK